MLRPAQTGSVEKRICDPRIRGGLKSGPIQLERYGGCLLVLAARLETGCTISLEAALNAFAAKHTFRGAGERA